MVLASPCLRCRSSHFLQNVSFGVGSLEELTPLYLNCSTNKVFVTPVARLMIKQIEVSRRFLIMKPQLPFSLHRKITST